MYSQDTDLNIRMAETGSDPFSLIILQNEPSSGISFFQKTYSSGKKLKHSQTVVKRQRILYDRREDEGTDSLLVDVLIRTKN